MIKERKRCIGRETPAESEDGLLLRCSNVATNGDTCGYHGSTIATASGVIIAETRRIDIS